MPIVRLDLRNYRVFRSATFDDLSRLSVVIGANGTGKSTLFDAFSFLKDSLVGGVHAAAAKRGGFLEMRSREANDPITIGILYKGRDERRLAYGLNVVDEGGRSIVLQETLIHGTEGSQPMSTNVSDDRGNSTKLPIVKFTRGQGTAIRRSVGDIDTTEVVDIDAFEEEVVHKLDDPSTLAISVLGQLSDFPVAAEFRSMIEGWHISNFHIAEARASVEAGYSEHLSTMGENVAQVAQYLRERHPQSFRHILEIMRSRVPGVDAVEAKVTEDGRLVLRFQDGNFKDPFIARHVSDGTIKMFAYLVLLHDPKPHPLVAIEEPENQLYPGLLGELAEEFRDYARRGGQAIISTHSPELLNAAELDEVFWLEKRDGFSHVHRAKESELLRNLVEEGDPLGAIWRQRLFDGVDP